MTIKYINNAEKSRSSFYSPGVKKIIPSAYLIVTNVLFAKNVFAAAPVTGQTGGIQVSELPNPLGVTSIKDLIGRITGLLVIVAIPVATLMIIVGAFQILSAGGDPKKFETGKKTIIYSIVGIAILFLADLFVTLVKELLGAQ